jgi:hypothetical protein
MSIFESKSQRFWRRVRESLSKFFGKTGTFLKRMRAEFRALPKGARTAIYTGGSMLAVLLIFAIFFLPMLSRPQPGPDAPPVETVADAIVRITADTQRPINVEEVPEIVEDIDNQATMTENKTELLNLYMLRARVFFNAMQYHDAAESFRLILDRDLIQNGQYFGVYSGLFNSYTLAGDPATAREYAALTVEEYSKDYMFDDGGCVTYAEAAGIDINVCPSIFDVRDFQ